MSYRQSNFDPALHEEHSGKPIRPFDRWQWVGVAAGAVGLVLVILFLGQTLDLVSLPFEISGASVFIFCLSGNFLLQRDPEPAPGTLDGRRKLSLFGVLLAAVIVTVDAMA